MSRSESIWLISQDESIAHRFHRDFDVTTVSVGSDPSAEARPSAIVFDPDQHTVKFSVNQIDELCQLAPDTPILVLSCWADPESVLPLLRSEASGYVLKSDTDARLVEAVREMINGEVPLSSKVSRILLATTKRHLPGDVDNFELKEREIELLQLMSEGLTKKEISEKYKRSVHTIDNHVRRIYLKMGVNNLGQAVGDAFRAGIIS